METLIKGGKISGLVIVIFKKNNYYLSLGTAMKDRRIQIVFIRHRRESKNPFGKRSFHRGIFANLFDAKDLDYSGSLTLDQRKEILENKFVNYVTPATNERFGSILGSAEGEASLYGDRVRGVRQQVLRKALLVLLWALCRLVFGTLRGKRTVHVLLHLKCYLKGLNKPERVYRSVLERVRCIFTTRTRYYHIRQ